MAGVEEERRRPAGIRHGREQARTTQGFLMGQRVRLSLWAYISFLLGQCHGLKARDVIEKRTKWLKSCPCLI